MRPGMLAPNAPDAADRENQFLDGLYVSEKGNIVED